MAADNHRTSEHDDLMESRRQMWSGFIRFSTYSIVGVCLILIGLALFLA
ncbi:hypothetical protein [Fodinicurvata sp. EGI_FJ10296]